MHFLALGVAVKTITLAVLLLSFGAVNVRAADLPVKAKAPIASVESWTGFYAGVNVGYGLGRDPSTFSLQRNDVPTTFYDRENFIQSPAGVIGGAQLGYNVQLNPAIVVGLEADFQGSGQRDSYTCTLWCGIAGFPGTGAQIDQKLEWFGTVRGRAGYTNGSSLFYLTGGFAYGHVNTNVNALAAFFRGIPATTFSSAQTLAGWTIGAGAETRLFGNWTGKIEYLYMDLGHADAFTAYPATVPCCTTGVASEIRNHVIRVGANYHLGGPVAAAVPTTTVANWTGFYIGANVGYGVVRDESRYQSINNFGFTTFNETFRLSPAGVLGGGQLGYNWQVAPTWAVGVEVDFQGVDQHQSGDCIAMCNNTFFAPPNFASIGQRISWLNTYRGRVGWTNGPSMVYGTAGFAQARVATSVTEEFNGLLGGTQQTHNFSHVIGGWTLGGGIETMIASNWSVKAEYLFVDLKGISDTYIYATPFGGSTNTISSDVREHIFRAGLNYHLGGPVVAKY